MDKVLIVEDEFAISQVLKAYLQKVHFQTEQAFTGTEAIEKFHACSPNIVLLDVMLPGKNGWQILKEIRQESNCPVIMLTALGDVNYRLEGLNEGADDYIAKPFVAEEVVARVKAVLRRTQGDTGPKRQFGSLEINLQSHQVMIDGHEIDLTPRDLSVLMFLAEHPNHTFSRDQLIDQVWGWEYDGSDRAVDLAIKRLRKALKDWPATEGEIKTLRGLGYQLSVKSYQS
ncbi:MULTISPECIES: response regulator transcription factor [Rummeliibacillus]|jgi:Response regulators consisting of a CheY-like receiver domain and a winged-helix DNA-binding domain|uniref:response regulator transcription factor n=1 Tax=Rummeliibacillus TaxID=648802 RepID=UPI0011B77E10|nr:MULTISPECIES: response regulator transcription factor [Rummeliibacillus]MBO2536350.1 response regulator transcription factor [Rummeliibacillus suwonensis]